MKESHSFQTTGNTNPAHGVIPQNSSILNKSSVLTSKLVQLPGMQNFEVVSRQSGNIASADYTERSIYDIVCSSARSLHQRITVHRDLVLCLLSFNVPYQFTLLLNLRSLIFGLTPFSGLFAFVFFL